MAPSGGRLKLTSPTIAVVLESAGRKMAEMLPEGSTVELLDPLTQSDALVLVRCGGRTYQMFSCDLRERGELIPAAIEERLHALAVALGAR